MGILGKLFKDSNKKNDPIPVSPDYSSATELTQIPGLFAGLSNSDLSISVGCASAIHRIVCDKSDAVNRLLYLSLRYIPLDASKLKAFSKFTQPVQSSLHCVASLNHNGYVREAALRNLIASPCEQCFPFVALRLADWVPIIRKTAEEGIHRFYDVEAGYLIKYHRIIDWLLTVERTDLRRIHTDLTNTIFTDSNKARILESVTAFNEQERLFVFRNLTVLGALKDDALQIALADKSYLIRLIAARGIGQLTDSRTISHLLKDRSQRIRSYAIEHIEQARLLEHKAEVHRLLFDSSAWIRSKARIMCANLWNYDIVEEYRLQINVIPNVGSIIGLSEVGNQSDTSKFFPILNSISAKMRAAALVAISNLDYVLAKEKAFQFLEDNSNFVKRTCCNIILKSKTADDLPRLRSIYSSGGSDTKRFVLRIISAFGGWSIAGDFIKALTENDEMLRNSAATYLDAWYRYSVRLGTQKTDSDKDYVLSVYQELDKEGLSIPYSTKGILDELPFIFK